MSLTPSWPAPAQLSQASCAALPNEICERWRTVERKMESEWSARADQIRMRWGKMWWGTAVGMIGCVSLSALAALQLASSIHRLVMAATACSLAWVLSHNADAVQLQTGDDISFIHLQTSLGVAILAPVPGIGALVMSAVAWRAAKGRYSRSGRGKFTGFYPAHEVGKTSLPLAVLLLGVSVAATMFWYHVFITTA